MKMKNLKTGKNKEGMHKKDSGRRLWKIVAIAVILIFAVIIGIGLIKAHYLGSSFIKPSQSQMDYAEKIAKEKLQSAGVDLSAFKIETGKKMRVFHKGNSTKTVMQVSFYNNATTHTYLVDINSGKVLLHSETDVYELMENMHNGRLYGRNIFGSGNFEHEGIDKK